MEHIHVWTPVPGCEYVCECGATGARDLRSGAIVAWKTKKAKKDRTVGFSAPGTPRLQEEQ